MFLKWHFIASDDITFDVVISNTIQLTLLCSSVRLVASDVDLFVGMIPSMVPISLSFHEASYGSPFVLPSKKNGAVA